MSTESKAAIAARQAERVTELAKKFKSPPLPVAKKPSKPKVK